VVRLFGSRGRTPKYRLGLYGPHSKDELEAVSEACTGLCDRVKSAHLANRRLHWDMRPLDEGDIVSNERITGLLGHFKP
jgi:hypothetical protein